MKTNQVTVSAKRGDNYGIFTTTFRLEFCENKELMNKLEPIVFGEVMEAWAPVIISALQARMESCVNMLCRNQERIIKHNKQEVVFLKKNGKVHTFNYHTFNSMKGTVDLYNSGTPIVAAIHEYQTSMQVIKALYWITEEQRQDHDGFSFGELISVLEYMVLNP